VNGPATAAQFFDVHPSRLFVKGPHETRSRASVTSLISRVNQRNSRISIHYGFGSPNARQYGQVSVFQPGNTCLTGKDLLTQYVGAANVEFGAGALDCKDIYYVTGGKIARFTNDTAGAAVPWHVAGL